MANNEQPRVVFRVRVGQAAYTCKGHLVWEGGIVYAVPEIVDDDCPFLPDRVRLEECDLELKHDAASGDWYQYHGFIFVY